MNLNRKKTVLVSIIVVLVLACVILGIILLLPRKNGKDSEINEICILKDCLEEHKGKLQSSMESICVQKECIPSEDPPEPNLLCVFKNCVSEVELENSSISICVEKKFCVTPPLKTAKLEKRDVCLSESCVLTAYGILTFMDQNVHPCDDFYEFSCGGYFRGNTLPEKFSNVSTSKLTDDEISFRIKNIIGIQSSNPQDSDALTKAKTLYKSCLDTSEGKSVDYLKDLLASANFGPWPALDANWSECNLDLERQMAILNAYGVDSFFKLVPEFKGSNNTLSGNVYFSSPLINRICDDTFESEDDTLTSFGVRVTQEYRDLMTSVFELLGAEENTTESDIEAVLKFDAKFCNVLKFTSERPPSYKKHKFSLQELVFIAPQHVLIMDSEGASQSGEGLHEVPINWSRWHYILFNEIELYHRLDHSKIYVHNIYNSIEPFLDLLENTPHRTIANYLSWKFIFHHLGLLKPAFRQLILEHRKVFEQKLDFFVDVEPWAPRWKQCVKYVRRLMPIALIPSYSEGIMDFELQREMSSIILAVKRSFNETFSKTTRLSNAEIKKVQKKLHELKFRLFYPNKDRKYYDEYYSHVKELGDSFLENWISLRKLYLKKLFEGVLRGRTITDLEYSILIYNPFETSAWSDFRGNAILLSFAALESTGIQLHQPKYLNYGSFGTMVGQLMAQGFSLANIRTPYNWTSWPRSIERELADKTRCFIYQFLENSTFYYQNVDIPSVVDNAIADNLGIQEVFKAYNNFIDKHGREKEIPGLNYSAEQLFFIKYAQFWCGMGSYGEKNYKPTKLRVNGALRNVYSFAETFRCHKNKAMNPPMKCKALWP